MKNGLRKNYILVFLFLFILIMSLGVVHQSGQKTSPSLSQPNYNQENGDYSDTQNLSLQKKGEQSKTDIQIQSNDETFSIHVLPTDNLDEVMDFITNQLINHGWQITQKQVDTRKARLNAQKEGEELSLDLSKKEEGNVSIQLSMKSNSN